MENVSPENAPEDIAAQPDLAGTLLDDFMLLRRLGRGGMADVYLAEQQSLQRQVAVKVLRRQYSADESYVRRFHNEARAAAALVHPNIVQIFEVGKQDDIHFIAQEYIRGQNLKQFLEKNGALDPFLAINIMRQVATALQKAGEEKIVHRDIKPENIMLSTLGEIKVADFGLARLTGDPKATDLTQVGITMGTPLYMSPEQIEGTAIDQRSDIYSLGVTCYQLLTGRPPYDAETALAVAVQHLKQDAVPLAETRPDLPQQLCDIVHRMIQKSPRDRFQSGSELLRALLAINIDSSETEWSAALDKVSLSEAQALYSKSRLEATHKLDEVIRKRRSPLWDWWLPVALVCAVAIGIGWLIPKLNPPRNVLADVRPVYEVEKKGDAQKQFEHAFMLNSEDGWLAVSGYFPPTGQNAQTNRYYGNLAMVRLAGYYLDTNQLDPAYNSYEYLYQLDKKIDENFRKIGLAGMLIVTARKGGDDKFIRENIQSVIDDGNVLDSTMLEELRLIRSQLQAPEPPTKSPS